MNRTILSLVTVVTLTLTLTLATLVPGDAHGSLINFDLTTTAGANAYGPGAAVFGAVDSQWNHLSKSFSATNAGLNDSLGGATGVTLTYTWTGSGTSTQAGPYADLGASFIRTDSVVFAGLVPNSNYNLAIFSPESASFSIAGVTKTLNSAQANWSSLVQGSNYVLFPSIKSDDTGTLSFTPTAGYGNAWSAFELQAVTAPVPEPSSYALFALGLGGLAFWKRRQKKA